MQSVLFTYLQKNAKDGHLQSQGPHVWCSHQEIHSRETDLVVLYKAHVCCALFLQGATCHPFLCQSICVTWIDHWTCRAAQTRHWVGLSFFPGFPNLHEDGKYPYIYVTVLMVILNTWWHEDCSVEFFLLHLNKKNIWASSESFKIITLATGSLKNLRDIA